MAVLVRSIRSISTEKYLKYEAVSLVTIGGRTIIVTIVVILVLAAVVAIALIAIVGVSVARSLNGGCTCVRSKC